MADRLYVAVGGVLFTGWNRQRIWDIAGGSEVDYHVKPVGKTCAGTGQPLVPGSTCRSALVEKDGQLVRLDFSEAGWSGPPSGSIGNWKSQVPTLESALTVRLDPNAMLRCFEQLQEEASPKSEKLRYALALMLLQRRRLQLDDTFERDGETWLALSSTQGEGNYEVVNFRLPDDELSRLQIELRVQLATEWQG